jgi:hypothetical protein
MKTQAWGWLAAAVLAAGLNASYHDGGLQWAHQIADQAEHSSAAVLALATGRADQFLAEAKLVGARNETASCRLSTALARVQTRIARSDTSFAHFQAMSARQEAELAQLEANRAQIEAQVNEQLSHIRIPAVALNPVVVRTHEIPVCPRIRVNIPRPPSVRIPVVHVNVASAGTV